MKRFLLVALVACTPARTPAPVAVDCGPPIAGIEKLAGVPLVIVGELHGQAGPPAFAADLACRSRATLALEIAKEEQPRIDAFLASDGGPDAKKTLLAGTHWTRPFQDGRSSTAMLGLLEQARMRKLRIVAVDDDQDRGQTDREQAMAGRLVRLVNERRGPVVMLVGNYHAHTAIGAPWDPKLEFMAAIVKKDVPKLVSLDERYGPGDSWVCFSPDANECGRSFSRGNGSGPPGTIEIFPQPDEAGFSGTYSVGDAVGADPAIGLTPAQETAGLVAKFTSANRPKIVDGLPTESVLGPEQRAEWCAKLMPVAQQHVPLSGDRFTASDACAATLVPAPTRAVVPGVKVKLDVGFFYRMPYAAASYDRETKTLFLPLRSLYAPWDQVRATKHEWLHARHHRAALAGDTRASALMTFSLGKEYRPGGFYADEVPVNLCDAVASDDPQLEMLEHYVGILRTELDAMKTLTGGVAKTNAGVAGHTLTSTDGVERWVGGPDAKKSLAELESVWKDATKALAALKADPPDTAAAKAAAGDCH